MVSMACLQFVVLYMDICFACIAAVLTNHSSWSIKIVVSCCVWIIGLSTSILKQESCSNWYAAPLFDKVANKFKHILSLYLHLPHSIYYICRYSYYKKLIIASYLAIAWGNCIHMAATWYQFMFLPTTDMTILQSTSPQVDISPCSYQSY